MGKNISVYLNDDLLRMVESSGQPSSQVVQAALKKYFLSENRQQAFEVVAQLANQLGGAPQFKAAIDDLRQDRKTDRW